MKTNKRTPWFRVLEKLKIGELVKEFPAFYGTRKFSIGFTGMRHLIQSEAVHIVLQV
jgi:hypothetical protein